MRNIGIAGFIAVAGLMMFTPACEHADYVDPFRQDTVYVCDPEVIYYYNDVRPIILSSCAFDQCHVPGNPVNRFEYTSYKALLASGKIVPYKPEESLLYTRTIDPDTNLLMPRPTRGPMSDTNISVIRRWIEQGAKNLYCAEIKECTVPEIVSFAKDVFPVIDKNCKGCHSGRHPFGPGQGLYLRDYSDVKKVALPAQASLLLAVINHEVGFPEMPRNIGKLDSCNIATITKWVNQGALNN